jgi:hypothetical protein
VRERNAYPELSENITNLEVIVWKVLQSTLDFITYRCKLGKGCGIRRNFTLGLRVGPSSPFDPGLRLGQQEWVGPVSGGLSPPFQTDSSGESLSKGTRRSLCFSFISNPSDRRSSSCSSSWLNCRCTPQLDTRQPRR